MFKYSLSDLTTTTVERLQRRYRRDGIFGVVTATIALIYREWVRSHVPRYRKTVEFNRVEVPVEVPYLDPLIPGYDPAWYTSDVPGYESSEVEALQEYCRPGDDVVIIGGGFGVTAVVAAEAVGVDGSVVVYEAAEVAIDRTEQTMEHHNLADRVELTHAIVGDAISLKGESGAAEVIQPSKLPEGDVYEIDCEGAEMTVLENYTANPRVVSVETHAQFGSPKQKVKIVLEGDGYRIQQENNKDVDGIDHIVALRSD